MNWKDKLEVFHGGDRREAKAENIVVSRILQGLGWRASKLHYLCKTLGIEYEDTRDFSAAKAILDHVSGGMFHVSSPSRRFVADIRKAHKNGLCWQDDNELSGLCHIAKSVSGGLILFCRVESSQGNPNCNAFVFTKNTSTPEPYLLKPISILRAVHDDVAIWVRKADALIRDMAEYLKWEIPGDKQ